MLIDETYFSGHLRIVNTDEPDPNNLLRNRLLSLIDRCEEEVLSFCMGVDMWIDFKTKYQNDKDSLPQHYKDILHGKTYTREYNGKEYSFYWTGLVDEKAKRSLLVNYVYVVYQEENASQATAFGQSQINGKVGELVSATPKITRAYNEFLTMLQGDTRVDAHGKTMEGRSFWVLGNRGISYYEAENRGGYVSFIQFLMDNKEYYPLLRPMHGGRLKVKNEFGI